MKFPYFATCILITLFCFLMFIKSLDYGKGWAIALSSIMLLVFFILSIISLFYHMRKHSSSSNHH